MGEALLVDAVPSFDATSIIIRNLIGGADKNTDAALKLIALQLGDDELVRPGDEPRENPFSDFNYYWPDDAIEVAVWTSLCRVVFVTTRTWGTRAILWYS